MEYKYLEFSMPEEGIGLLTLSAPQSLNALNSGMLRELDDFVQHVPSEVRVLLVTGAGGKAFVAGADISEMQPLDEAGALEFARLGSSVFRKIELLPLPVIAVMNGYALGGGCELALACDLRITSERSRFGQPEVGLGIIPGFSGTVRLTRIVGPAFAKELIYTGKTIDASEAYRMGLVNAVVPAEQLMEEALQWARRIMANSRVAVSYAKRSIQESADLPMDDAIALENRYFAQCFLAEDQKEGMTAFLEKRKPKFL